MKRSWYTFAAALALALAATAQSRADTVFWYNWSRNPVTLPTVQKNSTSQAGTGGINLLDLNSTAVQAQGSTGNPAADVQVISSATNDSPDMIAVGGGKYTLTLNMSLQDPVANPGTQVATVSFQGQLQGTMTALSSNLTNTILSSTDAGGTHSGQNFATLQLGGETFTVAYTGFAEPGPSDEHSFGAISFHIDAGGAPPTIGGGQSPEPSGVVLGCLGLLSVGGVVWRARRRKAAMIAAAA